MVHGLLCQVTEFETSERNNFRGKSLNCRWHVWALKNKFDKPRISVYTPNITIEDRFKRRTRVEPAGTQRSDTRQDIIQRRIDQLAREGSSCVSFNIRKAARAVTQLYDERMRPLGLRSTQLPILGKALVLEPVTVTRLAEATMTDRTTLTRNLRLLEQQGLVQVERGDDRRERAVRLTNRGREVLAQVYPIWQAVQAEVARRFGSERLARLLAELSALSEVARLR
jgi:DNA-binding MarR family transcriptional regulator